MATAWKIILNGDDEPPTFKRVELSPKIRKYMGHPSTDKKNPDMIGNTEVSFNVETGALYIPEHDITLTRQAIIDMVALISGKYPIKFLEKVYFNGETTDEQFIREYQAYGSDGPKEGVTLSYQATDAENELSKMLSAAIEESMETDNSWANGLAGDEGPGDEATDDPSFGL